MLGRVGHNELRLRPVARFPNNPVRTIDGLHWNILELYRNVLVGLHAAVREEPRLISAGIDSWAVDYALLRGRRMLGNPYHYRDERTGGGVHATHDLVAPADLYAGNGLQFLPFNTLYQLAADRLAGSLDDVDTMLLIPDLLGFWLTGEQVAERTNASTTGLLRIGGGSRAAAGRTVAAAAISAATVTAASAAADWDDALIERLGLPRSIFPRLVSAGERIGSLLPDVAAEIGSATRLDLLAVGSHDTASAIVAVPMTGDTDAFISSGTWSLVGVELASPVLTEASRAANFTNEGGVDGRVRYLRNVMGLWLLSESLRTWEAQGSTFELPFLLAQAAQVTGPVTVFAVDDPRFLAPGDMPARIRSYCAEHGLPVPGTPVELVRSIVESLAAAYAETLRAASELSGMSVRAVHIVGGGSQNDLLCQLTANRTGLTVLAGPVEATAIGNVLVQARAQGLVTGSLDSLRALVAQAYAPRRYRPAA
ncbi:rhamnulokinase [Cryobacterium sp. TMT2-18-3]|uniref:rhamnulokinase n=1 Tax=unclassified Cryobacterium TaxID=2649013 RepID=UPI00106A1523|nr:MULTISPECIES: rhamnulokinase family protein [unclassified Cryobacterium]TFC30388.1 rhamnulokinase [Cryobacterium sp. TMT2-18-2]TFC63628.1 rhamnulokinase [Cryobacterium sp. TMT2-18-3]